MVLPLYLAMTPEEMAQATALPPHRGWFDPESAALPHSMSPGTMLILHDRFPCPVPALKCESVLLDFEQVPDAESRTVADALFQALPCPVAAPPGFIEDSGSPVFLPSCPLHVPLAEYLRPWQGREIWLDVTLQQQTITVTRAGTTYAPPTPADRQGGVFDETLLCRCVTEVSGDEVRFTLFDTPETLKIKLEEAARLGVSRAVGLYQELGGKL